MHTKNKYISYINSTYI